MHVNASQVTGHDVARRAGVSQPTVSRALRGDPRVAPATRRRVLEAAADLGYVPNATGRALASRSTRHVAIVATDMTNPFYPHLLAPLHDELDTAGYRTMLFTERADELTVLEHLLDGSIDGVVLTSSLRTSRLPDELARRSLPFVMVNRHVPRARADICVVDNRRGAAIAAEHLVALGHRRIGAVHGPRETSTGHDRERGFAAVLAAHGIPVPREYVHRGPFDFATGRSGMDALLDGAPPPTAVFCANDVIALGALDAAAAAGRRVPEDVTVIGFDDIPMAGWAVYDLTTVRQDIAAMARVGVHMLLTRMADPALAPREAVFEPELVLRGSHAPH